MTPQQFQTLIKAKKKEIHDAVHRRLPVKLGRMAVDHFKDNFRQSGFVNNGLHPWQKSKRQNGKSTKAQYKTLMSARNNLYGSLRYVPGDATVTIGTTVPYAAIHNNGGVITSHPSVTPKMRKYAWFRFFNEKGKAKTSNPEANKWKALALTKKQNLTVTAHIPQRQFIGDSKELRQKANQIIDNEITNILKS